MGSKIRAVFSYIMLYLKRHASHHISSIFCIHPRIDYYDGRDATEVMDAFHSAKGGGSMRPCGHAAMVVSCWGIQWDETTSRTRDDEAYASLKESQ